MQEKLTRLSWRTCIAAAGLAAAPAAFALSLGELDVRSALGEPLDARIPLSLAPGEEPDPSCFTLARDAEAGVPVVTQAQLTVEPNPAGGAFLRIRTPNGISEPALRLRVRAGCAGQTGVSLRQYSVLLDPRKEPVTVAAPLATPPAPLAVPTANVRAAPSHARNLVRIEAQAGDTLDGLAARVFPRVHGARQRYLAELREANPALASLGDGDAIPEGASVALPDLRDFAAPAHALERSPGSAASAEARPASKSAARASTRSASRERNAAARAARRAGSARDAFVLKLSNPQIDVSALRDVDDETRARLRERQLTLDSDDQVAQVLALRNSVRLLEARVNELQLKLAQMPASFPERAGVGSAMPAPGVPAPSAPGVPAPSATASDAVSTTAPGVTAASGNTAAALDALSTGAPAAQGTRVAPRPPRAAPSFTPRGWETFALWAAFLLVLGVLLMIVWRLVARRSRDHAAEQPWIGEAGARIEPVGEPIEIAGPLAAIPAGAVSDEMRRRYLEERFPEVLNGTLRLDDAASVVRMARLFHQDGALTRAIELLHLAIEDQPQETAPWLALFEIYRHEELTVEFAQLARRFHDEHGEGGEWPKVQQLGREIDPDNLLYKGEGAAGPANDDWLGTSRPANEALATELRQALLARANLGEHDLAPDPLPALRDADTFTVA